MPNQERFEFKLNRQIPAQLIDDAITKIWDEVAADPSLVGLDSKDKSLAATTFTTQRPAGGSLVVGTILVAVATALAEDVVKKIWEDVVWPALKRRFGTDIDAV
jgi:hypothetical protein